MDPERVVFEALQCYQGMSRTFMHPSTRAALQKRGIDGMREAAKNYTMIPPINMESALQQGGVFVFDGPKVLYAWCAAGAAPRSPPLPFNPRERLPFVFSPASPWSLHPPQNCTLSFGRFVDVSPASSVTARRRDEGTADHAPLEDILGAVAATA